MTNWSGTGTVATSSTYRLTSLANVNSYLGFTTGDNTTRDTLLTNLIDRATSAIESYCDRKFKSRSYRLERYDGDGTELLFLRQKPIVGINSISLGSRTVLTVNCTDADAVHASVDVDSDGVTLNQINGTGNGVSNLTFSSYATISAMGAKIDSYTGWDVTVETTYNNYRASDLLDLYGAYCLNDSLYMQIPDTPIQDFTVYKEGGLQMGIIHRNAGWTSGTMNVIITYTAGYTTIPYDVEQACIQLAGALYNMGKRDLSLKHEKLGDYEYTVADSATSGDALSLLRSSGIAGLLGPWRSIWVV